MIRRAGEGLTTLERIVKGARGKWSTAFSTTPIFGKGGKGGKKAHVEVGQVAAQVVRGWEKSERAAGGSSALQQAEGAARSSSTMAQPSFGLEQAYHTHKDERVWLVGRSIESIDWWHCRLLLLDRWLWTRASEVERVGSDARPNARCQRRPMLSDFRKSPQAKPRSRRSRGRKSFATHLLERTYLNASRPAKRRFDLVLFFAFFLSFPPLSPSFPRPHSGGGPRRAKLLLWLLSFVVAVVGFSVLIRVG